MLNTHESNKPTLVQNSRTIASLVSTRIRLCVQSFGVGAAAVGTTLSAYALARLMMNIPSGIIADTRGRKPLMVWGPAITALGASL